jgi:hypothetical protein
VWFVLRCANGGWRRLSMLPCGSGPPFPRLDRKRKRNEIKPLSLFLSFGNSYP